MGEIVEMGGSSMMGEIVEMGGSSEMGEIVEVGGSSEMGGSSNMIASKDEPTFVMAQPGTDWHKHLSRGGSTIELRRLLKENPRWVREKSKGNVTVLHKAVHHGHLELVQDVMSMFDNKGRLTAPFCDQFNMTLEDMLCQKNDRGITAVMLAGMVGNWDVVELFKKATEVCDNNQKGNDEGDPGNFEVGCSGLFDTNEKDHLNLNTKKIDASNLPWFSIQRSITDRSDMPESVLVSVKHVLDEEDHDIVRLKASYQEHVDYNSAPIEEVFFHFLCGCSAACNANDETIPQNVFWDECAARVARKIIEKLVSMYISSDAIYALFKHHDPRGRTPLHVASMAGSAIHQINGFNHVLDEVIQLIPVELTEMVTNVKDKVGCTIFDITCMQVVEDILNEDDPLINSLKEEWEEDVDYNFRQMRETFFHFLVKKLCLLQCPLSEQKAVESIAQKIVGKIQQLSYTFDHMYALFKHLDPQGRTPLHVVGVEAAYANFLLDRVSISETIRVVLELIPEGDEYDRCVNVRDSAGRTIFHQACILDGDDEMSDLLLRDPRVEVNRRMIPIDSRENEYEYEYKYKFEDEDEDKYEYGKRVWWHKNSLKWLEELLNWRSPHPHYMSYPIDERCFPTGLHLLILHGNTSMLEQLLSKREDELACAKGMDLHAQLLRGSLEIGLTPLQLAAAMGESKVVELLLELEEVKDNGKLGGLRDEDQIYSVIHIAAAYKRLKVIQTILNKKDYDPMITKTFCEKDSPLHLVATTNKLPGLIMLQDILPQSNLIIVKICLDNYKVLPNQNNYDANDIVCINIMLQVGFDIWSRNKDGREPYPGVGATIEAYNWWYNRVGEEVRNYKEKLNGAMGAISVIATLVATASFIGPLQPPLGYDNVDGFVQSTHVLIKIYFVCNGLSFYLAVASILAAVTPAIPMLRESTQDEIRRSQRSSKVAISLLLFSIIAILVSFSCSSIVVMPFHDHDRIIIFCTIGVGVAMCVYILVMFILRMVSQILNQPDLVKRFIYQYQQKPREKKQRNRENIERARIESARQDLRDITARS